MGRLLNDNIETLWQEYFQARGRWDFKEAKRIGLELLDAIPNRIAYLRHTLGGAKRNHASLLLNYLEPNDLIQLFDRLIYFASYLTGFIGYIRTLILRIPHEWVMEHIETYVEPYLKEEGGEEYRRFLELYILLDADLTKKLAERAAQHPDPETKEAGEDFIEMLGEKHTHEELVAWLTHTIE